MALQEEITLTFKEDVDGFTTFKSYVPDWGISLRNRYYTFRLGNPWEHNIETDEVKTDLALTVPITVKYEREDVFSGAKVFEITGDIGNLGFRTDDQLIISLWDETAGVEHTDLAATIPDPAQDMDMDENPELHITDDVRSGDITLNTSSSYFITRVIRVNKNRVERNIFYGNTRINGAAYESRVEFVINDEPSTIKQFKTLGYEGLGEWDFKVYTDVESEVVNEDNIPKVWDPSTLAGIVRKTDLVQREGKYFANIQGSQKDVTNLDYKSSAVEGVGVGSPTGLASEHKVKIEGGVARDIKVNHDLYFLNNLSLPNVDANYDDQLYYAGTITSIDGDVITYDPGQTGVEPNDRDYFMCARKNIIEKSGVIGSFAHVIMTNDDSEHAEVFSVNSEVVKSSM